MNTWGLSVSLLLEEAIANEGPFRNPHQGAKGGGEVSERRIWRKNHLMQAHPANGMPAPHGF